MVILWLRFIITKGYKAKSADKRLMGISPGETRNKLLRHPLPL